VDGVSVFKFIMFVIVLALFVIFMPGLHPV